MPKPELLERDYRKERALRILAGAADILRLCRSESLEVSTRAQVLTGFILKEAQALRRLEDEWWARSDYRQQLANKKAVATARKKLGLPPSESKDMTARQALLELEGKAMERRFRTPPKEGPKRRFSPETAGHEVEERKKEGHLD